MDAEAVGAKLRSLYDSLQQELYPRMEQHPITTLAVIAAVVLGLAVVGRLLGKLSERRRDRESEGPHLKSKRVSRSRAIVGVIWAGSTPERFLRRTRRFFEPVVRVKQKWPTLARKIKTEMLWIFGGTGSGKSSRVLAWMLAIRLKQGEKSIGVFDPKGNMPDLLEPWLGRAGGSPRTHLVSSLDKHEDSIVGAIDVCADEATLQKFLDFVYASQRSDEVIWQQGAQRLIRYTYTAAGGPDLPTLYDILVDTNRLDGLTEEQPELMRSVWTPGATSGPHPSAHFNVVNPLAALDDPLVRRMFERRRARAMNEKLDWTEREAAFLCVSPEHVGSAAPLVAGLVGLWQDGAAYRPFGPPVELYVDEAGICYPLRKFNDYIQLCREAGVNLCLAAQDIAQIRDRMGNEQADSTIGAARAVIVGPSRAEATQQWTSRQCGTAIVERHERQPEPGMLSKFSGEVRKPDLKRKHREPRVRDEHVGTLDEDKGEFFLVRGSRKPLKVKHRPIFGKWARFMKPRKSRREGVRLVRPVPDEERPQAIEPQPTPHPEPTPQPEPTPEPEPRPQPEPRPEPPRPEPQPAPEPEPEPQPQPEAQPEPQEDGAEQKCRSALMDSIRQMQTQHGISVTFASGVVSHLVNTTSPDEFPAVIEAQITDRLGDLVSGGQLHCGANITVYVKEGGRFTLKHNQLDLKRPQQAD